MSGFSRRDFLAALGVGLAAAVAPWGSLRLLAASAPDAPAELWGRALYATFVRDAAGAAAGQLFPDQVVTILGRSGVDWQVEGGSVDRAALQPIAPRAAGWAAAPEIGDTVQVISPYAPVLRWCAAGAPQAARLGWGAAARVVDAIADRDVWLGVSVKDSELLGWSRAGAWETVSAAPGTRPGKLRLNRAAGQLVLLDGGRVILSAAVALPPDLLPGRYVVRPAPAIGQGSEPGAPWQLDFGAWRFHGVYWHNRFAGNARPFTPYSTVEATVLTARAIYEYGVAEADVV